MGLINPSYLHPPGNLKGITMGIFNDLQRRKKHIKTCQDRLFQWCKLRLIHHVVYWNHGYYEQRGFVVDIIGVPWNIGLRVVNLKTMNVVDLDLGRVTNAVYDSAAIEILEKEFGPNPERILDATVGPRRSEILASIFGEIPPN
jgi:hypothetical protein